MSNPDKRDALERSCFTFAEFFAGGGMARAGLGEAWQCVFANDFDFKKSSAYRKNWGDEELLTRDIAKVELEDLPDSPDLAWASFPCQDLSLAGMGAGLRGDRSGTFWPFWDLIQRACAAGKGPKLIVLENVCGTLTSHGGRDFNAIAEALASQGYAFGAFVLDAERFLPQSRPRLFIVGAASGLSIPAGLTSAPKHLPWFTRALQLAHSRLPFESADRWVWWNLAIPPGRTANFEDLMEETPSSVQWHSLGETERLLQMMSDLNLDKIQTAQHSGERVVGTAYKRTRRNDDGEKVQRAEVRFDGIAGCLRTAAGGSSRQVVVVVEGSKVRSRLLSAREAARLMGLSDNYSLPENYNDAYHLLGDGVAVPVVRHIARHVLEPILKAQPNAAKQVA